YPKLGLEDEPAAMLTAFLGQYYLSGRHRDVPDEVVVSDAQEDQQIIALAIADKVDHGFRIISRVRGPRAQWLRLAQTNADQALLSYVANKQTQVTRFAALQEALDLPQMPERLECFDISHSSGEATVASCVVFDQGGPKKSDYRTFNIQGITPGDDYAAMTQAITRRYTRLKENQGVMPDILIVDGGKGQLTQATKVLSELQLHDLFVLGVAKGETRKAGFERLFNGWTGQEIVLPSESSALHLLQHIRDESHRFAITGHRARRNKKRTQSNLQQIDGVGPKRRQALLQHFGGIQDVTKASVDELAKVKGISVEMADIIYRSLRGEEG
ncbi:MAG: excinuclease ABC subunit UvrC, partial [Oceanospirillaceae bacterium]|nr:excinuclease ABC subunit UvrC [Oceanospirillaceae bacterium]